MGANWCWGPQVSAMPAAQTSTTLSFSQSEDWTEIQGEQHLCPFFAKTHHTFTHTHIHTFTHSHLPHTYLHMSLTGTSTYVHTHSSMLLTHSHTRSLMSTQTHTQMCHTHSHILPHTCSHTHFICSYTHKHSHSYTLTYTHTQILAWKSGSKIDMSLQFCHYIHNLIWTVVETLERFKRRCRWLIKLTQSEMTLESAFNDVWRVGGSPGLELTYMGSFLSVTTHGVTSDELLGFS